MSGLKRKDGPGGNLSPKSAKKVKDDQVSKPRKSKLLPATSDSKSTSTKPSKAATSSRRTEEPLFPRGGGSVLTPLERKQINIDATADANREEEFSTSGKVTKKGKKDPLKKKKGKDADVGEAEEIVKIEALNIKVFRTVLRLSLKRF